MIEQTMKVPFINMTRQYDQMKDILDRSMQEVVASGNYIMGTQVTEFEQQIANYCGVKYAIGVANGTDALVITLDALGIGLGDEVITTPFTFFATAESISRLGATPIFIDIHPETYNLDVRQIEKAITKRTKAILPVHLFGQSVDMDEVMSIAKRHNLYVIEDACQSLGATYKNQQSGSIGTAGCFSFFPTKNLGCIGDGGMIVTNNEDLATRIRLLIHGSKRKNIHSQIGYHSILDTLQAAVLMTKLPHLNTWNDQRNEKALIYNEGLNHLPIQLPIVHPNRSSIYHLYVIQTNERDELKRYLDNYDVGCGIYYPVPLHLQEVYDYLGYQEGDFPIAEQAAQNTLALPLFPEITMEEQEYVISVIKDFYIKGKQSTNAESISTQVIKQTSWAQQLINKLKRKQAVLGVVGLGTIGLPSAVQKAKAGYSVIGFDVKQSKIDMINNEINGIDGSLDEDLKEVVSQQKLIATSDYSFIQKVDVVTICVPTPLDKYQKPNSIYIEQSIKEIARYLHPGMLIVIESTTYPGTIQELVKPILEQSGLICGVDFFLAYSSERVDLRNKYFNINSTPKIGVTTECTKVVGMMYRTVLKGEIFDVKTPAMAEMEKLYENTFRNINIALTNEMATLCSKMNINVRDVIDATKTKADGLLSQYPRLGPGSPWIPSGPFYLTWKAREFNEHTKLIEVATEINKSMCELVIDKLGQILKENNKTLKGSTIFLLGIAYKKDTKDYRESLALKVLKTLIERGATVDFSDPYIAQCIDGDEVYTASPLVKENLLRADIVVITTDHTAFDYDLIHQYAPLIFDTKNAMGHFPNTGNYYRL